MLELSTTLRELGDSSSRWDSAADTLESTDLIDSQEMKDLVPFNHLRNSRADSGLTYWQTPDLLWMQIMAYPARLPSNAKVR